MECHFFRMLIQRYYDSELDPAEQAEYENHRRTCSLCREMDRQFAGVFKALDDIPLFAPSRNFNEKILVQVEISRYRIGLPRRISNAISGVWDRVPSPVRVWGTAAVVFSLFVTVYRPFLDLIVSMGEKTVFFLGTGLLALRELPGRSEIILKYLSSATNYKVAGETLLRALQKVVFGIPLSHIAIGVVALLVVLFVVIRTTRTAWKKGETHVGIF